MVLNIKYDEKTHLECCKLKRGFLVKGQKDDRVEISWREGWFCTVPHPVTQAVCVFALLQRQKSWDRAACGEEEHTRGKRGKTMARKKGEDRDGDCWREEKQVLQFSATEVLGSCSQHWLHLPFVQNQASGLWEAPRRRIVGSTQKESTAMLL